MSEPIQKMMPQAEFDALVRSIEARERKVKKLFEATERIRAKEQELIKFLKDRKMPIPRLKKPKRDYDLIPTPLISDYKPARYSFATNEQIVDLASEFLAFCPKPQRSKAIYSYIQSRGFEIRAKSPAAVLGHRLSSLPEKFSYDKESRLWSLASK